ncbi:unnamed protein product [Polarella glacialis]|uniref:Protein archease-like n=1 Tax=Polarella glacialis TaxID=89957 RepID=A0A813FNZ9_POLGL|nr:unnamed protein product [Polarella glacialis]
MAAEPLVPHWLEAHYPGRKWQSLRSCALRLGADGGAGLELEAYELGYLVDLVDEKPGQDPAWKPGSVVVAIGGLPLLGLGGENAIKEVFGAGFRDSAELLLLDAEELRRATVERDSQEECPCAELPDGGNAPPEASSERASSVPDDEVTEHGSVVQVSLRSSRWLEDLTDDERQAFVRDLGLFAEKMGVRTELHCTENALVLAGIPEEVSVARAELEELLRFYWLRPRATQDQEVTVLDVYGMLMNSMPARNRRRRKAPEAGLADLEAIDTRDRGWEHPSEDSNLAGPTGEELRQYEYMDHTADVILHSWGRTLEEAFAQACVSFFSYMTELDTVDLKTSVQVEATGHDITDLLYHLLDEFLFSFGTEFVICRRVEILELDPVGLRVRARGHGEKFDLKKHPQGTEIKAITMHQMKVLTPDTLTTEEGTVPRISSSMEGGSVREGFPFECYVLVDI